MKILIVDDSKVMRMIIIRTLRQIGLGDHDFVEAANGVDALAEVDAADLVLCDWNMPEMTGIEFLEHLRAEGNRVPFGFITSESATDYRERAIAAGAAFMLAKPFKEDAVKEALGEFVAPCR